MSASDHAGGEDIPVGVNETLTIAEQIALPLQPRIEELGIFAIAAGHPRILNLDHVAMREATRAKSLLHLVFATDEDWRTHARIVEGVGGAHDAVLLALGKDDALGRLPDLGKDR